jgi:hypothetical protein
MVLIKHSSKKMDEGVLVRLPVFLNFELDVDVSA